MGQNEKKLTELTPTGGNSSSLGSSSGITTTTNEEHKENNQTSVDIDNKNELEIS
eukprot:CAMPEP_0201571268 /NCGR_PEP_ID=MMETSP0190_2-20130828/13946_1 /ASSEMBLY_ACC=CAM_ASM_000263 /TAXON_ID=37353 /ORGANISM="Rosalina sp." /LENGTH=54 /DNA_ID=CAMNT_0047995717 /DNA_START=949 /DNA_END=1113 /DNA_ORIENTATION=+